jgi:hypothetical protein
MSADDTHIPSGSAPKLDSRLLAAISTACLTELRQSVREHGGDDADLLAVLMSMFSVAAVRGGHLVVALAFVADFSKILALLQAEDEHTKGRLQ